MTVLSKENDCNKIFIVGARENNLKNLSLAIEKHKFHVVTGVSGSGKSSLVKYLLEHDGNLVKIDKENTLANSRSNVVTYTKIFDIIRDLFAKENHVRASEFSFNSSGACPKCNGAGVLHMDMHFLGDVKQVCDVCHGKRYKEEVLHYLYQGKSIDDVLDMTILEAYDFFAHPMILKQLKILKDVGLEYLKLGRYFIRRGNSKSEYV